MYTHLPSEIFVTFVELFILGLQEMSKNIFCVLALAITNNA
jgi:hypothetical protein